ncbi:MAG: Trk system potassium transporter TrkA [Marinilabiliales bacterium]|nr:MAG: Trk system potassium transporter TrkA [Marinilabiliales bacterium]
MNIFIAGDGEVGFYIAEALVNSNHDITIIDPHEELLKMVEAHTDLLTIVGESNSVGVLKQAGVDKADLVISVLHDETVNIITSILAKKLGAKNTIARVNTLQHLSKENVNVYKELGIDYMISPEDISGHEVVNLIKNPQVYDMFNLSNDKLSVYLIKIEDSAPVANKTLVEIAEEHGPLNFRAIAINRDQSSFIPTGDSSFKEGDMVYVVSKPDALDDLLKLAGKKKYEISNIMVVGGGRVGKVICRELENDYNIKLIENDTHRCHGLTDILTDTLIINGDARNVELLDEEGIENTDVFIAVTNSSETNILTCLHAKKFGVKKTIALVENLDYIEISQNIGIDTILNKKLTAASNIVKHAMGNEVSSLKKCLSGINSDIVELVAMKNSPVTKKPIRELKIPEGSVIGGIIRGNESFIAVGNFQILEGDKVVVFALPGIISKVEKMYQKTGFGFKS